MWQFILSGLNIVSKRSIFEYFILRRGLAQLLDQFYYFVTQYFGVLYKENAEISRNFRPFFTYSSSSLLLVFIGEAGMFVPRNLII
jgi:hypothetical protein